MDFRMFHAIRMNPCWNQIACTKELGRVLRLAGSRWAAD